MSSEEKKSNETLEERLKLLEEKYEEQSVVFDDFKKNKLPRIINNMSDIIRLMEILNDSNHKLMTMNKLDIVSVKFKKLHEDATLPVKGTNGSACFDLSTVEEYELQPGEKKLFSTGLSCEFPAGYEMEIRPRSGFSKNGIIILNSPGTVDSDYRGEILISMMNISNNSYKVQKGERIAQFKINHVLRTAVEFVDELSETERNENGFGSTGKV